MTMKLTYRGINYQAQKPENQSNLSECDAGLLDKHLTKNLENSNRVIQIKPIYYYTYRGVSYTKNLFFDTDNQLLIDVDRK